MKFAYRIRLKAWRRFVSPLLVSVMNFACDRRQLSLDPSEALPQVSVHVLVKIKIQRGVKILAFYEILQRASQIDRFLCIARENTGRGVYIHPGKLARKPGGNTPFGINSRKDGGTVFICTLWSSVWSVSRPQGGLLPVELVKTKVWKTENNRRRCMYKQMHQFSYTPSSETGRPLDRPRSRREDNIKIYLKGFGCEVVNWIWLSKGRNQWLTLRIRDVPGSNLSPGTCWQILVGSLSFSRQVLE
jgi:hypothetical protein